MMEQFHRFGITLLWVNGAWLIVWFGVLVWLVTLTTEAYITTGEILFFQVLTPIAVLSLIEHQRTRKAMNTAYMPWLLALLAPLLISIIVLVRLFKFTDRTICEGCWQGLVGLGISAVVLSAIAFLWYLFANYWFYDEPRQTIMRETPKPRKTPVNPYSNYTYEAPPVESDF